MSTITKSQINMAPLSTCTFNGIDFGATNGGADAEITTELIKIKVDQSDGPIKSLVKQVAIKGTVRISQEVYAKIEPFFQGVVKLPTTTKITGGGKAPGTETTQVALVFSNGKKKLTVWAAVFTGTFKPRWVIEEGAEVLEAEFEGENLTTRTAGDQMWEYEDLVS